MKTIISGLLLLVAIIAFSLWLGGDRYKADLSNNIPDYQEGNGSGHPLWRE